MKLTKRGRNTILAILLLILVLIINKLLPKNYEITYKVNKFNVTEKYLKKDKMYIYNITKGKKTYETIRTDRKIKKQLVSSIKEYSKDKQSCIVLTYIDKQTDIICLEGNSKISYHLTEDILPKKYYAKYKGNENEYKKINTNIVDDKTYLIWNYTGFYKLTKDENKTIDLFKNDTYNPMLAKVVDKYLIIADYDQDYNFNRFIRINLENDKKDTIDLTESISFDSRIIGVYKNSVYLVDNKNKKEYEIDVKKGKYYTVSKNKMGKILKNGKLEKIKLNKIISDDLTFEEKSYYSYKVDDSLFMYQKNIKAPTKISDKKDIKTIVAQNEDEVYYLIEDSLYKYNFKYGETKILDYFELNFNYENIVFIY